MNIPVKSGLTQKQTALVDTLVAKGCSIKQASAEAGYAEGESGRVSAMKALKQPHVQQYMMSQVSNAIGINATIATAKIMKLANGAKSEYVQLEASKDIKDRAGYKATEKHMQMHAGDIKVNIDLT
jgi:hypothetical protein